METALTSHGLDDMSQIRARFVQCSYGRALLTVPVGPLSEFSWMYMEISGAKRRALVRHRCCIPPLMRRRGRGSYLYTQHVWLCWHRQSVPVARVVLYTNAHRRFADYDGLFVTMAQVFRKHVLTLSIQPFARRGPSRPSGSIDSGLQQRKGLAG